MSKQSTNLGKRLYFTVDYNDGTAYIGDLNKQPIRMVKFSNRELIDLCRFITNHNVLSDVTPEDEELLGENKNDNRIFSQCV